MRRALEADTELKKRLRRDWRKRTGTAIQGPALWRHMHLKVMPDAPAFLFYIMFLYREKLIRSARPGEQTFMIYTRPELLGRAKKKLA